MFFKRRVPKVEELEAREVPATFTVTNLNDSGLGSLRAAVADANLAVGADSIDFQAGLTGTIVLTTGALGVGETLTVNGPGADVLTVSGNNADDIFEMLSIGANTLTVNGLRLVDANGSAIRVEGDDSLNVADCVFDGNVGGGGVTVLGGFGDSHTVIERSQFVGNSNVTQGGGLYAGGASIRLTDVVFNGNDAGGAGGGAYLTGDQFAIVIQNVQFLNNHADSFGGGLVVNTQSTASIADSIFSGNTTDGSGGGLDMFGQMQATIVRSDFVSNNAGGGNGGGAQLLGDKIDVLDSTFDRNYSDEVGGGVSIGNEVNFVGSTFSNNVARRQGGGIAQGLISDATLINSTVTGNSTTATDGVGGGIDVHDHFDVYNSTVASNSSSEGGGMAVFLASNVTVVSSIVADNTTSAASTESPDISGDVVSGGNNLFGETGSLGVSLLSTDRRVATANLGPLQNNGGRTLTRLPGGEAVGRGSNPLALTTDQRGVGFPRAAGAVDIGAVEGDAGANDGVGASLGEASLGIQLDVEFTTPETTFLQAVYRRVLGREVDPVGLQGFGDRLRAGESRETIVREIWESKEHRALQASLLVGDLFGGGGDAAFVAPWQQEFADGKSTEQVIRELVASHLATQLADTTEEYIANLYERLLEREPTDAELATWVNDLRTQKIHTGDVADFFVNSTEFHQVLVRKMYAAYLDRDPESPTGLEAWTKALDDGESVDNVAIFILSSDEFLANVDGVLA